MDLFHISFFFISPSTFNSLAPVRNKGNYPLLVPILDFFTSSTILPSLPTPFLWLASLRFPKKLRSEGARSWLCGGEEERSIRVSICNAHHHTTPLLRALRIRKVTYFFRGAAVASGTFRITIKFRVFLLILTEVYEMRHNILGKPRKFIRIVRQYSFI